MEEMMLKEYTDFAIGKTDIGWSSVSTGEADMDWSRLTIDKTDADWSSVTTTTASGTGWLSPYEGCVISTIKTESDRILDLESKITVLEHENDKLKRSYQKLLIAIMNMAEEALNNVE